MTIPNNNTMQIIKRNGKREDVRFDKISSRIKKQSYGLNEQYIDTYRVSKSVIDGIYDGVTSQQLDELAVETAAALTSHHPDYSFLASRLAITAHYKETSKSFSKTIKRLHDYVRPDTGLSAGLISDETYKSVMDNAAIFDSAIVYDRDFLIDYFGFKTLTRAYLLKIDGKPIERVQHMWMRVAVGIWGDNTEQALRTYEFMSQKFFTHATPTLFNAGTTSNQFSSCFLLGINDSIYGMYGEALTSAAIISKYSGGIGMWAHDIRAKYSYVKGTNGSSNGLIPYIKVLNETARHVDQAGKRKGSFAIYLEPTHPEIFEFLDLRKNTGAEELRARDIFTALWLPDLFFQQVEADGDWCLFSPDVAPGLSDVYDDKDQKTYTELYRKYEAEGRASKVIKAFELWNAIRTAMAETGVPYMMSKDSVNRKSNQKNIGVVKSSNLCTEITEVSVPGDEIAVCNLASLALPMYLVDGVIDHDKLYEVTYQVVVNLNKVIDINFYPVVETEKSNRRHRPIGVGVQGLANLLATMKLAFDSPEAAVINKEIFETIYFAAVSASCDLAKIDGPYETFAGSPASQGILQFDMWEDNTVKVQNGKLVITETSPIKHSGRYDWDAKKAEVMENGLRNSLLLAPMPTASTAQILGNNESFEPFTNNLYKRETLSGEFVVVNRHLVTDLIAENLWNTDMKNAIIMNNGSVQGIESISLDIRERYKTVWEIKQRSIIDMAADRGAYICQSQSMNLHIPNDAKFMSTLSTTLLYGWKKGLKTLSYYTRSKAPTQALKGLAMNTNDQQDRAKAERIAAQLAEANRLILEGGGDPDCEMCSS